METTHIAPQKGVFYDIIMCGEFGCWPSLISQFLSVLVPRLYILCGQLSTASIKV